MSILIFSDSRHWLTSCWAGWKSAIIPQKIAEGLGGTLGWLGYCWWNDETVDDFRLHHLWIATAGFFKECLIWSFRYHASLCVAYPDSLVLWNLSIPDITSGPLRSFTPKIARSNNHWQPWLNDDESINKLQEKKHRRTWPREGYHDGPGRARRPIHLATRRQHRIAKDQPLPPLNHYHPFHVLCFCPNPYVC